MRMSAHECLWTKAPPLDRAVKYLCFLTGLAHDQFDIEHTLFHRAIWLLNALHKQASGSDPDLVKWLLDRGQRRMHER